MAIRFKFPANIPRRNLVFFGVLLVCLAALFIAIVEIPDAARSRITGMLEKAGFPDTAIGTVTVHPNAILANGIKLDRFGFDEIASLKIDISALSLLTGGEVSQITLKGLHIARQPQDLSSSGRQLVTNLLNLPPYRIAIKDAVIDLGTDFGDIRITGEATINGNIKDKKSRDIKARIGGDQFQLGFDSKWEGSLSEDGKLELSGTVEDGRVNIGPMRISRFNGWMGASASKNGYDVQSQMEAGSATFMDIPLHDLSLVNDHSLKQSSVIFRSGVSGLPDVLYAADFLQNDQGKSLTSIVKGESLGKFLHLIGDNGKNKKSVPDALDKNVPFEFAASYQPERRFVGGPLPFALGLILDSKKQADGNILFYPDSYDVRGSMETDADTAAALQRYFKIPASNVKQNFIRLDGSAKNFFHLSDEKEKSLAKN